MSPITNTRVSPDPLPTLSAGDFFFYISIGSRPQAAGHRLMASDHRAQAAGRRLSISPRISPTYKAAGRRSSILEPSNSIALSAPNKNRSPGEGQCNKKKLTPLHLKWDECHAIWDLDRLTLLFLTIFNSNHTGTPFMHRYTSGIPSPERFSILSKCVFLGRFCFNSVHSDRSVFGIFNPLHIVTKSVWVILPDRAQSGDNIFTRQVVELMNVVLFTPIDSQTAQAGAYLLSVDGSGKLTSIFSSVRQFIEAFKLIDQGHAIFSLALFSKFFDKFWHFWKRFAVKKFSSVVSRTVGSISSLPCTLSVAVSPIDIIFGKLSLPVGQARWPANFTSSVFCGFSLFQSEKPFLVSVCRGKTVTTLQKCYSYNPYWITFVTFVTFVTLFSEILFFFSSTQKNPYMSEFYALTIPDSLIRFSYTVT